MALKWVSATEAEIEFTTEMGDVTDRFGTHNDGPCLVIGNGEEGVAIEGTVDEIEDLLWKLYETIRPERAAAINTAVDRLIPDKEPWPIVDLT